MKRVCVSCLCVILAMIVLSVPSTNALATTNENVSCEPATTHNGIQNVKRVLTNQDITHSMVQMTNKLIGFGDKIQTYIHIEPSRSIHITSNVVITERVPTPPLINQLEYKKTSYGEYGSVASHGCGISAVTMLYSYLLDQELDIVEMSQMFGKYNTPAGSSWSLLQDTAQYFNLPTPVCTYSTKEVVEALENGQMVIALQHRGLFTSTGHFLVLTGISESGRIFVNDSNGRNYSKNATMQKGFANGFTQRQIFANGGPYWIYQEKKIEITTLNDDRITVTYDIQVTNAKEGV